MENFLLCRLTAFIVKVLTRSREYFSIQDNHISKSISYLVNQQQPDGSFHDHHPVLDRSMQVGHSYLEEFVVHLGLLGAGRNNVSC